MQSKYLQVLALEIANIVPRGVEVPNNENCIRVLASEQDHKKKAVKLRDKIDPSIKLVFL